MIFMRARVIKQTNAVSMATSNLFNSLSAVAAKLEQIQRVVNDNYWGAVDIYDSIADKSVKLAYINGINGVAVTYAIIPIVINGTKYYELAIADIFDDAELKEIRTTKPDNIQGYRDYSVSAVMKTYNGKPLTRSSRKWFGELAVYADGDIVRNGESMNKTRRYKYPDSNYYHTDISVNLETVDGDKTQSMRVSHIVFAAMMGMQIDALKLMTVPKNMLCNFNTDNIAGSEEIMKWRNNGVQWHIDHINNLTHDNSIYNLQLVTAHANYVLREIRNTNCEIAVDDLI